MFKNIKSYLEDFNNNNLINNIFLYKNKINNKEFEFGIDINNYLDNIKEKRGDNLYISFIDPINSLNKRKMALRKQNIRAIFALKRKELLKKFKFK